MWYPRFAGSAFNFTATFLGVTSSLRMNTATSPLAGNSLEARSGAASAQNPRWYDAIWFEIAIALVAGFFYALLVMGPTPLNPRNVNWVAYDPAYHYVGWEMFRQDPHLHWPLTYTDRLGYPKGESVALIDLNPLMAVVLKPLSPLLPEPAQYFGIEVVLACALQFFFAFRLLRLLIGPNVIGAALGSAVLPACPAAELSLLGTLFLKQSVGAGGSVVRLRARAKARAADCAPLCDFSGHPGGDLGRHKSVSRVRGFVGHEWLASRACCGDGRSRWRNLPGVVGLLAAAGFAMAYAFGLVISGGRGYGSGGYRDLSMNLLAPIDPRGWTSLIFPRLHSASFGQYEGYNYLGAGVLIIAAIAIVMAVLHRGKLQRPDKRWLVPLAVACLLLTLLALSTKVTLGGKNAG